MAEFYPDKRPNFRAALKKLKVIQKEVRDAERAAKKKAKSKRMDEDLSYMVAEVVEESAPKEQVYSFSFFVFLLWEHFDFQKVIF